MNGTHNLCTFVDFNHLLQLQLIKDSVTSRVLVFKAHWCLTEDVEMHLIY